MTQALIVGGGLAGLITSIKLANHGIKSTVFEPSALGGRAASRQLKGQNFNLGPHALYQHGHTMKILRGWGLSLPGGDPQRHPSTLWMQNALHPLPGSLPGLLTHPALAGARIKTLLKLAVRPEPMDVATWLKDLPPLPRAFVLALIRLSTYAPNPESLSAPSAFDQLQLAQGGVFYPDGGWQSVVDALEGRAKELGVSFVRERALSVQAGQVQTQGKTHRADEVIVATSAPTAQKLLGQPLAQRAVTAACLCLGFKHRPEGPSFCLGLERPLYASMHSDSADLGPGAVLHLMHYGQGTREELESWADALYPSWRDAQTQRWLPALPVTYGLLRHGIERPAARVRPGLLIAGDYVGPAGMLADASAASAQQACQEVLQAHRLAVA